MNRSSAGHSRWPIVAEAVLFVLFFALLVQLHLGQPDGSGGGVRWWTWLAVGTPFFLALGVEWRRKKRPALSRQELLEARVYSPAGEQSHHPRSEER